MVQFLSYHFRNNAANKKEKESKLWQGNVW
nr:MAG TPA: hypothetical protein [Caudoviricetes sp.]